MSKKEFLDELIIEMIDEVEQSAIPVSEQGMKSEEVKLEEQTIYTGLKIKNKWIYFEERLFVEDKVTMMIPEDFEEMSLEDAKKKYPSEERPKTILTDETTAINIMFNYMDQEIADEKIEKFRDQLINGMKWVNPGIKPRESGSEIISDKTVAYVEFTNPVLGGKLYNLLYFMELEGHALMMTFNCMTKDMKYWKKAAFEMMKSIKILDQINEEDKDGQEIEQTKD